MGIMDRFVAKRKDIVHEDFDQGAASFEAEEGDKTTPTLIGETSMAMDDADAIKADQGEVERLAPGSPLATEVEDLEARALADVEKAKAALADAQEAQDDADVTEAALRRDVRMSPLESAAHLRPRPIGAASAVGDQALAEVSGDRDRIIKDLATASSALADADAAKEKADQEVKRASAGETEPTGE